MDLGSEGTEVRSKKASETKVDVDHGEKKIGSEAEEVEVDDGSGKVGFRSVGLALAFARKLLKPAASAAEVPKDVGARETDSRSSVDLLRGLTDCAQKILKNHYARSKYNATSLEFLRASESCLRHNTTRWTVLLEDNRQDANHLVRPKLQEGLNELEEVLKASAHAYSSKITGVSSRAVVQYFLGLWYRYPRWSKPEKLQPAINAIEHLLESVIENSRQHDENGGTESSIRTSKHSHPEWHLALQKADCVKVMRLLTDNPDLLYEGWERNEKILINGRPWEGRTVLHVAAMRGCPELAKQALDIIHKRKAPVECETEANSALARLLESMDGSLKLDPIAMGVINGNSEIVKILTEAANIAVSPILTEVVAVSTGTSDGITSSIKEEDPASVRSEGSDEVAWRELLDIFCKYGNVEEAELRERYKADCEFNFLPFEQYFLHFYVRCSTNLKFFDNISSSSTNTMILRRKLLHDTLDGKGRLPLHVAIESGNNHHIYHIWALMAVDRRCVDAVGRSPLYLAVAANSPSAVKTFLNHTDIDTNATFCPRQIQQDRNLDLNKLAKKNGYSIWDAVCQSTALHLAILKQNIKCVEYILVDTKENEQRRFPRKAHLMLDVTIPYVCFSEGEGSSKYFRFNALQLAVIVGNTSIVRTLIKDLRIMSCDRGWRSNWGAELLSGADGWSAFHLAAAIGNPGVIRVFLEVENFDPLRKDDEGNTALHYVFRGKEAQIIVNGNLRDCVNCCSLDDVLQSRMVRVNTIDPWIKTYDHREGSINLLLQSGIDIWETNKDGHAATPGPDANREFLSWWYRKVAQETQEEQTRLNNAANAITVTAALVATASYVGPLQPPLGYGGSSADYSTQIQVHFMLVKIFVVCDTLSFYLAIAAIILALIPSLPMLQESAMNEIKQTRRIVAAALGLLFPSILSILLAFAAASIVAISVEGSWHSGGLAIGTAIMGGFACLLAVFLFLTALLRLIFHRSSTMKWFHNELRSFRWFYFPSQWLAKLLTKWLVRCIKLIWVLVKLVELVGILVFAILLVVVFSTYAGLKDFHAAIMSLHGFPFYFALIFGIPYFIGRNFVSEGISFWF